MSMSLLEIKLSSNSSKFDHNFPATAIVNLQYNRISFQRFYAPDSLLLAVFSTLAPSEIMLTGTDLVNALVCRVPYDNYLFSLVNHASYVYSISVTVHIHPSQTKIFQMNLNRDHL